MASESSPAAISCWQVPRLESHCLVSEVDDYALYSPNTSSPSATGPELKLIQCLFSDIRGSILLLHVPCNNFASLFVVRFFLGLAEACIVPAFLLILSMFFTYDEQGVLMQIMWACGNSSPITSGLLSYGVLYINTGSFAPWKWFMGESPLPKRQDQRW